MFELWAWLPRWRRLPCTLGLHWPDELVLDIGTLYYRCGECSRRRFIPYSQAK